MEKMRSSTAPVLWVLVVAFGLLFMLQDTQVFDAVLAGPRTMGEVNGKPVTSEQFNQRLNAFTEQHRQQTGNPPSREQLANYQDNVWEQLIVELALESKMEELGIKVTDQEIRDAVFGENPDPIIRQYFSLPDGSIDRGSLRAFVEAPEAANDWIIIENQIRDRRQQAKINQYVQSSIIVTNREIEQEYANSNTRASISFVRFPYSEVTDEEITVSDSDLRSYHKNNGSQFEQDKTWRFRYVTFSKLPTAEDTTRTLEMMTNMRESFAMAENDSLFLLDNFSTTNYNGSYRPATELDRPFYDVLNMETGEISEAVIDGSQAVIYKKTGERRGSDTFVRARRIQLNFNESNKDQKRAEANEMVSSIRGGADFSDFLSQSNDRVSAAQNGDIGFITREDLDTSVTNPLFRANEGSLVGPIEYEGAYHVFQVVEKTNAEVSFVTLGRIIEADPSLTVQSQQIMADDFREFANLDGFEEEAARNEYVVQEATATEGSPFIAGLGESRITMRALDRLKAGSISEVIELDDMFVVLHLDEVREKGVRPLSEVQSLVEAAVKQRKRKEVLSQRIRSEYNGLESLEAIAEASGKQVQTAANIRMNSTNISGGGREPGVIGAVFGAEIEQLSGPIDGENAVFFFVVDERQEANMENLSDAERTRIRTRLQQQKTRVFTENLVDELKESADIKDHRQTLGMMQ